MAIERKKQNELFLTGCLVLIVLLLFAGSKIIFGKNAVKVEVSVNGRVADTYSLSEHVDKVIENNNGGTNHLVIEDGGASMSEASCPDKVCVRQGVITETGQSLVCLPNKVIVTLK